MTTNQIKFAELKEAQRHNKATEAQKDTELGQSYEVGTKQAAAALSNASANHINAATRQQELEFAERQYDTTGANKAQSEIELNKQKFQTESGKSQSAIAQGQWDAANYGKSQILKTSTDLFGVLTMPMLKSANKK